MLDVNDTSTIDCDSLYIILEILLPLKIVLGQSKSIEPRIYYFIYFYF